MQHTHIHDLDLVQERDRLQHDMAAHREGILEFAHDYNQTRFELDTLESNIKKLSIFTDENVRAVLYEENTKLIEHLVDTNKQDSAEIRVSLDVIVEDIERLNDIYEELSVLSVDCECELNLKGDTAMNENIDTSRDKEKLLNSVDGDKIKGYQIADLAREGYGSGTLHSGNDLRPLARDINDHGLRSESFNVDKSKQLPEIIKDLSTQVEGKSKDMNREMSR